jgi:hypothetical protein
MAASAVEQQHTVALAARFVYRVLGLVVFHGARTQAEQSTNCARLMGV